MAADETRVDAADVLAEAGVFPAYDAIEALREAAGGGWVCIAPDGTLWADNADVGGAWERKLLVAPVEAL